MKNRPIFIKLKNYVEAQGYTIQQIQDVTADQVKSLLSLTEEEFKEYQAYANGIKKLLIQSLQAEIDNQTLVDMKAQVHTWMLARFPSYNAIKDFSDNNNRIITFYLDGGPE